MNKWVFVGVLVVAVTFVGFASTQSFDQKPGAQTAVAVKAEGMTNSDIIKMVKAGLSADVIIASIRSQQQNSFDLSPDALIELRKAGVPANVVIAMHKPASQDEAAAAVVRTNAPAAAAAAAEVTVAEGTAVPLRLMKAVSSETAKAGDPVDFEVASDVVVEGQTVIKRGELALGKVKTVTRQLMTRGGKLELSVESVRAANGAEVPLRGSKAAEGGRRLVRANEATIGAGTLVNAEAREAVKVTVAAAVPAVAPAAFNVPTGDVATAREPGIYAIVNQKFEPLEPAAVTGGGVGAGDAIKSGLTFGLKKVKAKADVRGPSAGVRVPSDSEFYFYGSSFNPNTFVLAKLESREANRQIVIGEGGVLGVRNGIRDEDQVTFRSERVASGVYKVTVSRRLLPGEYAFIDMKDTNSPKLWDFGVDR